jgi:small-conductance mechanosensitive channel
MTARAAAMLVAALLAGAAAHFALRRASRRLPRALALRRGVPWSPTAPTPRAFAFAVLLLQTAAWLGAAWLASQQFASTRAVRGEVAAFLGRTLATPLFTLGDRGYTAQDLLVLPLLVAAVWLAGGVLTRLFRSQVLEAVGLERGVQETLATLLRYALCFLGTLVVLQVWGVDLRSVAILASVLGVGIGFGLQNIANNFVSGVLINLERPVRSGDFVRVGEFVGSVLRVGARSTTIRTLDRVTIVVPNSRFLESEVVNWSHGDPVSRVHVPVGVAYGSDVRRVRHTLLEVARAHRWVLREPRPDVQLLRFGESSLDFDLLVWTEHPERQLKLVSDLNVAIESALRAHGIAVPFPQRDLHLRSPSLERALDAWTRRQLPEALEPQSAAPQVVDDDAAHASELVEHGPEDWSEGELAAVAEKMRGPMGVAVADRRYLLSVYRRCFVGSDAVDWLCAHAGLTRREAAAVGQRLVDLDRVRHVLAEHGFRDGNYFYRFREDDAAEV